jgi:hypothetical protein
MKKPAKRAKSGASSKAAPNRKTRAPQRRTSTKSQAKSARKSHSAAAPKRSTNLKHVAKKAAQAALLAAGAAVVQTTLSALGPEKKPEPAAAPKESRSSH